MKTSWYRDMAKKLAKLNAENRRTRLGLTRIGRIELSIEDNRDRSFMMGTREIDYSSDLLIATEGLWPMMKNAVLNARKPVPNP